MIPILAIAILVPLLIAAGFVLGRHAARRLIVREELSAVTRQHIDLFQGGQLSETAMENAKARLSDLLERGELAAVEANLRPGMQYVVNVRALAEIGTDDAGKILERQLHRRLSDDQLEQSWYWIDLANGLRTLNREESLPHLLRCSEAASNLPLGHFFAAETACIMGFGSYVRQPRSANGRAALRLLQRAMEGLRYGVQPLMIVESRLGEVVEDVWDHRAEGVDPLVVRVAVEVQRLLRRAPHHQDPSDEEASDWEGLQWQMSRLEALEPVLDDYCEEAPPLLCEALPKARGLELRDCLLALIDLRTEAADAVLPLVQTAGLAEAELMLELLSWSKDERVGPWLREWTTRRVSMKRRAAWRRRPLSPARPSVAADFPYRAVLRTLRGHGSSETECFLHLAANDWDPTYRGAAISSLGWWEPYHREKVMSCLVQARRDPSPEVRRFARAALARLGQRHALQWFRNALTGEDTFNVHEAIQMVSQEGLTVLWPDLDHLTQSEDDDIAQHATEALEHMREEMDHL